MTRYTLSFIVFALAFANVFAQDPPPFAPATPTTTPPTQPLPDSGSPYGSATAPPVPPSDTSPFPLSGDATPSFPGSTTPSIPPTPRVPPASNLDSGTSDVSPRSGNPRGNPIGGERGSLPLPSERNTGTAIPSTTTDNTPSLTNPNDTTSATTTSTSAAPTRAKQQRILRGVEEPGHPFVGLLTKPTEHETIIDGKPLTLADLLKNNRSRAARRPLLHTYWGLAALLAECQFLSQRETEIQSWLKQFRASDTGNNYIKSQIAVLEAASQVSESERKIREIEFVKKQYELASLIMANSSSSADLPSPSALPIPCDYPLVTTYLTRIDKMHGVTPRAKLLDKYIAAQYKLVAECMQAQAAASNYSTVLLNQETQSRMHDTLAAYEQWLNARMKTARAITDYNCMIADFVCETVGDDLPLEDLLEAHIKLAANGE
ncbi:MAG: hypothetical protein LBU65_08870 [Planctomycetaceae bacterium]|jgi:hypothetical protein|nr:hypothetical protein [Planctomycetaceae bacterium]